MALTRPRKVFLDANVVIRAGKPPGSPLMPRVADLVDAGYIKIVSTDLTKTEIAKKHASNDFEALSSLTKRHVRNLANELLGAKIPEISSIRLHEKLLEKYRRSVDQMFETLRAETISIDTVKPSLVFESYARRTGLFGVNAKKDQFPDAFTFEALRQDATKADPLIIVSDDKDFAAAIKDAEHVIRVKSIADLFAALGLMIEAPDVNAFLNSNTVQITAIVNDELNQFGLQVSDIDDAEIDEATVESVNFTDFRTFRTTGEDKKVLVVGYVEMGVNVSYHHPDWDTATYDSEDKVLIPHHTVEGEKDISIEAEFNMTLQVDQTGKPTSVAEFSFSDDDFGWVSIGLNDLDYK